MGTIDDMCYVKDTLLAKLKEHCCNPYTDAKELGEVADIVKDMCEAEYYCTIIEAMNNKATELPIVDGVPLPAGYRPPIDKMPYINDYLGATVGGRMGYNPTPTEHHSEDMSRYGRAYREYERARKHYTATKDEGDKKEAMKEMKMHMDEHVRDVITTFRQMWTDADPEQRVRLRHDLHTLLEDMKE